MNSEKLECRTEERKVNDLLPQKKSPRKITKEQTERLRKSLDKFNLVEVVVVDTDGTILAGLQRVKVLKAMGRGEENTPVRNAEVDRQVAKEEKEIIHEHLSLFSSFEKYSLDLLELCDDSEKLAKKLVSNWLKRYMFKDEKNVSGKIRKAVNYFSSYDKHLLYSRPLSLEKLNEFDLKIELADEPLQDLLWETHILLNH